MPNSCAVDGCGYESNKNNVELFRIPFLNSEGDVQKARREKWITFVSQGKCQYWKPTKYTSICSQHFTPESFQNRYDKRIVLQEDEYGVSAVPTLRKEPVSVKVADHLPIVVNYFSLAPNTTYRREVRKKY